MRARLLKIMIGGGHKDFSFRHTWTRVILGYSGSENAFKSLLWKKRNLTALYIW